MEGIGVPIQSADGHVKILHTFARIVIVRHKTILMVINRGYQLMLSKGK